MKLKTCKYFLIILFPFVYINTIKAQQNSFDIDVQELTKLTIDTSSVHALREVMSSDLLKIEREGFKRVYDSIAKAYNSEFENYYRANYIKEEIKLLLDFHKTATGKKFGLDFGKLYQKDLPEQNPLYNRLLDLSKKFRDWQPTDNIVIAEGYPDIVSLENLLCVKQHLDTIKAHKVMNVEPRFEADYIRAFDRMAAGYLYDLEQYFRSHYTDAEIKEILLFYDTPLGRKVSNNSPLMIEVAFTANDKWVDNISYIMKAINFGKFQREHFRKNGQ